MLYAMLRLFVAAALPYGVGAIAAEAADLYQAQTIVTGQGEANRIIGFGFCLEDVLIKVSGVQNLADDPRLAVPKANASNLVRTFRYHDRMTGISTHDEQGTRDRPYDLIVDFSPEKIDDLLDTLGLKAWLAHRPVLGVFAGFDLGTTNYVVTDNADRSTAQRESLLAAAAKRGMPVVLPSLATLEKSNIDNARLSMTTPSSLASIAAERGGEVVLIGQLVWVAPELGWAAQWRMEWQQQPHQWQFRGVTFDEAFRRGIGGAAQILSGHGDPQ